MPEIEEEVPERLRPFIFHGVDLDYGSDKEALGECPWCGKSGKFSVVVRTGQWRCLSCNEGTEKPDTTIRGGNIGTFITMLQERSLDHTTMQDYEELAHDRKIGRPETFVSWGVGKSPLTGEWMVPGYSANGTLSQLYKYTPNQGKMRLLPTPPKSVLGHKIHGLNLYHKDKSVVYLCEGPWDGIALWEALASAREDEKGQLVETANIAASLLADANVLAVPGCQTFFQSWLPFFAGKVVNIMYDNDHPRTHPKTGDPVPSPSLEGMRRVAAMLAGSKPAPETINCIRWGEDILNLQLPDGYDVRDELATKGA